jgi:hypothetical protein
LAAVVLSLPALRVGAFSDDFFQHLVLEGSVPVAHLGPSTLYDFTGGQKVLPWIESGYLPWHSHPDLSLRFFRPLASWSITLDHALFGRANLPGHLINVAWFLGLTAVAIAWFKELLPKRRAALASVLFAVAGGHAMNVAWTSTRHLLISAVFGALGAWLHVRQREAKAEGRSGAGAWVAWPPLALALAASEAGLAALALIVSYETLGRTDRARSRLLALAFPLALTLGYLGFYALSGYGVRHSGLYISPFADPFGFAKTAASRLPILVGELTAAVPASLWGAPPARPALVVLGCSFATLVAALLARARLDGPDRRRMLWLGTGALLGALPAAAGILDGRMLALPMLAALAVVVTAIDATLEQPGPYRVAKSAAGVLLALHLGLALFARVGLSFALAHVSEQQRKFAMDADLSACSTDATGLIVTGSDPGLSLSGATSLVYYRPELIDRFKAIHVLSMAPQRQTLLRSGERSLVLTVEDLPREIPLFEQVFRDTPLAVGYEVDLGDFGAKVLETEQGFPTRVSFRVPAKSCLLVWRSGRLVSEPLPARGTSLAVQHEPGPFGL